MATILLIQILEHLFAALMFKIDVDIRGFIPFAADEPLEQQVAGIGVDTGHAKDVTDRGVGGRTSSLAEDSSRTGKPHQVPDRKKVSLVVQFLDQLQFVFEQALDFRAEALGVTPRGSLPNQFAKILQRRLSGGSEFLGILVAQFIQPKVAAFHHFQSPGERCRDSGKLLLQLILRAQMPFRVRLQERARLGDSGLMPRRCEHIVQRHSGSVVIQHIARRHQRQAGSTGKLAELAQSRPIVDSPVKLSEQISAIAQQLNAAPQGLKIRLLVAPPEHRRAGRQSRRVPLVALVPGSEMSQRPAIPRQPRCDPRHQPSLMCGEILPAKPALSFGSTAAAERQQTAEISIAASIGRPDNQWRRIVERQFGADQELEIESRLSLNRRASSGKRADDSRQRIFIGDRQTAITERNRPLDQLVGMRRSGEEGVVGAAVKFSVHRGVVSC